MESVERHLRGWLAHRLGRNAANHLTRVHNRALEDLTDRSDQLVERLSVEAVLADDLLGAQVPAQENLEELDRVPVSLGDDTTWLMSAQSCLR